MISERINNSIPLPSPRRGRGRPRVKASSQLRKLPAIDALFSVGLYVALGAACISNLRITPHGPALMLGSGGYPFLYEMGVAGVLLATFLRLFHGIPVPNKRQKLALAGLALFYIPIFLNFVFQGFEEVQLIGGGQLRLQVEVWTMGSALILYPMEKRTVRRAMVVVVLMAFANSLYTLGELKGIELAMYKDAYRIPGNFRYSGFLEMPGELGVLCAIAISWLLRMPSKKCFAVVIMSVCGFAVIIADSRTGMVAILAAVAARIYSRSKTSGMINVSIAFFCLAIAASITVYIPESIWLSVRPLSIWAAVRIWTNHPLGVAWGTFAEFNPFLGRAVSPHNWPAIALLYGGMPSLIAVVLAHIWILRLLLLHNSVQSDEGRFQAALVLVLIAITVSAWFEQILQNVLAAFVYVTAAACLAHRTGNGKVRLWMPSKRNS